MRNFKFYTVLEFIDFIDNIVVDRDITHTQVHHTWKPTLSGYKNSKDKEQVIRSMWTYHTVSCGWYDIAQHFTFVPGGVFVGRSLERAPAGIANANTGGICVEILGDFDIGKDSFTGAYKTDVTTMFAALQNRFPVPFVFHNEKSEKTCPGTSIIKKDFIKDVNVIKEMLPALRKQTPSATDAIADIGNLNYYKVIGTPPVWIHRILKGKDIPPNFAVSLINSFYAKKYGDDPTVTYSDRVKKLGRLGIFTSLPFWLNINTKDIPLAYMIIVISKMSKNLSES